MPPIPSCGLKKYADYALRSVRGSASVSSCLWLGECCSVEQSDSLTESVLLCHFVVMITSSLRGTGLNLGAFQLAIVSTRTLIYVAD